MEGSFKSGHTNELVLVVSDGPLLVEYFPWYHPHNFLKSFLGLFAYEMANLSNRFVTESWATFFRDFKD